MNAPPDGRQYIANCRLLIANCQLPIEWSAEDASEPDRRLPRLRDELMRVSRNPAVVAAIAATLSSALLAARRESPAAVGPGPALDATQVLAAAREALGGEKKLSAVKTFTATGRTRQVRGNNLVPIEFEINCALPDRFVRTDEFPAQDAEPTTLGFNGDDLIQLPPPSAAAGRAGGSPPPQQRVATVKQDFVRLTLGMFATSFPAYPLTFKYIAQGEAPEGKADILDVTGPGNLSARFVVQRDTHLPVMLMWQAVAQGTPIDSRIYYGDFRDVDGLKWPFRLRRAIAGETIEETTFDRIRINVKIDPRKFEIQK
jgi:hypothetical protein